MKIEPELNEDRIQRRRSNLNGAVQSLNAGGHFQRTFTTALNEIH